MAQANEKMASFKELRAEIDTNMIKVNRAIDVIRKIIHDNIYDDEHEDGLLIHKKEEYLACLDLKQVQL